MFFTQEDYIKIQQWLVKNSVKDIEFNEATIPFNGNEIVSIVQGNQNKRVFLKDLVSQIFNLGVSDFVNITDKYNAPNISLEEAIRFIPSRARKEGQVITFLDREDHWHIYQFKGALNQWNILDTWEDLFDWENLIIDSILPDEEDLTKSEPDANGNSYLSLKDREYKPEDFSGLGRVILRKNIMEIEDPIYGKVKKNILYQDMINKSNTIYEIRYDFDLNGKEITIPEGCVLNFQGGSLQNGGIDFNNSTIKNCTHKAIFVGINNIKNIHDINVGWFKHDNNNITEFLKVVNIGDIVINFDSNYYTADISGLLLKNNTIIKGVNRDFSHINFNPNGDDYIIGLSAECKIFDIELKCLNASYEGDIVRMSNEFLKQNDIHNWEIRNVAINGQWEMTDVKSCGIAVICNEKDSKGNTNERVSLSYARMFENILIRPIRTGIRFEIIQETPNLPLDKKVWCNSFLFRNIEIWGHHGIYFNVSGIDGDTCRFAFDKYMFQGGHTEGSTGFYCEKSCPEVLLLGYNSWDCKNNGVIKDGGILYVQLDTEGNSAAYRDENGNNFGFITEGNAKVLSVAEIGNNNRLFFTKQYNGNTGIGVAELFVDDETLKFLPDRSRKNSIEAYNKYNSVFDAGFTLRDLSEYPYIQGKFSGQPNCPINPLDNREGTNLSRSVIYKSGATGRGYVVESSWIPFDSENMKVFRLNYNIDYCVKRLNLSKALEPNTLYRLILDVAYTSEENLGELRCLSIFPIVETFYTDNSMGGLTIVKSNFVPSWKKIELWVKTYDTKVSTFNLSFILRSSLDTFNTTIVKDITLNSQDVVLYYTGVPKSYAQDKDGTVFNNTSTGTAVFSTNTNKPVWKTDEYWIYADGVREGTNYSGTFAQKPTESERGISIGFGYFCTDRKTSEGASDGIMIYYKGSNVWVDALGRVVN